MTQKPMANAKGKTQASWDEFDCLECTAHNPWNEGFTYGDEVFCSWCGIKMLVRKIPDDGETPRYKLVVD